MGYLGDTEASECEHNIRSDATIRRYGPTMVWHRRITLAAARPPTDQSKKGFARPAIT